MQIVINVPEKEFSAEIEDRFQDFFKRFEAETKEHLITNTSLLCGTYELETIKMFLDAFKKMEIITNNETNRDRIKAVGILKAHRMAIKASELLSKEEVKALTIAHEITPRTKDEQKAYFDGFEMCADCIEKYLTNEGKQKLECLLLTLRKAIKIEE
jgi:hypothetical protein